MLKLRILLFIWIYEKEKVYNIEGQLRGLQGSGHPKTCASRKNAQESSSCAQKLRANSVLAQTP
jgi:hypothetical protein